jgi:hypothetical protein
MQVVVVHIADIELVGFAVQLLKSVIHRFYLPFLIGGVSLLLVRAGLLPADPVGERGCPLSFRLRRTLRE